MQHGTSTRSLELISENNPKGYDWNPRGPGYTLSERRAQRLRGEVTFYNKAVRQPVNSILWYPIDVHYTRKQMSKRMHCVMSSLGGHLKTNCRYKKGNWFMRVEILVPAAIPSREESKGHFRGLFTKKNFQW